jgi:hypothetical protein
MLNIVQTTDIKRLYFLNFLLLKSIGGMASNTNKPSIILIIIPTMIYSKEISFRL